MSGYAWTGRHDWEFSLAVMACNPPKYTATCRRCGQTRLGHQRAFDVADCPGRVMVARRTPTPVGVSEKVLPLA